MSHVVRRSLLCVLVVVSVVGGAAAGSARADGSDVAVDYQLNASHNGFQPDALLLPPFVRRWKVSLSGPVSYPLIANGMIYVTAGDIATTLYALDQQTGQIVWSKLLPFSYGGASPAYDAGRVFVVNGDDPRCCQQELAQAYAATTGTLLWTTALTNIWGYSPPPTAYNGVVYVSGSGFGGSIFALDEATGARLSPSVSVLGGDSTPAVTDSSVFGGYACNQVYSFAPTSLLPIWHDSASCYGSGAKTPVYASGELFTRYYSGNLVLDAATGALIRTFSGDNVTSLAPAADASRLFTLTYPSFGAQTRTLSAQDIVDGTPLWAFTGDGQLDTAPIVVSTSTAEFVIEGSQTGMLYILDAHTGTLVWSTNVGAGIREPDERTVPWPGLAAGRGILAVPAGNTLSIYGRDDTPPALTVPGTLTPRATSLSGATVQYDVNATDPDDSATATCLPASGTTFPVGPTTVECTATDSAANITTASFLVVVSAVNADCNLNDYPTTKSALNLKNGNLSGCFLGTTDLTGANLQNANLSSAYLADARLRGAQLSQANLEHAVLTRADLGSANLNGADLANATVTGANLTNTTWSQTTCPDGTNSTANGGTCLGHLGS